MAIVFTKTQKRQRLMGIILIVVVLATAIILFAEKSKKFIAPISSVNPEVQENQKVVEIDFQIFNLSIFDELEAFSPIPVFDGVSGRDNPFSVQKVPLLK